MISHTTSWHHIIAITAVAAALGLSGCIEAAPPDNADPASVESIESSILTSPVYIHRAYQPSTNEHFYTPSAAEASAAGFLPEAWNYYVLESGQPSGAWAPFYRCWWPNAGKHFYTTQANCERVGWQESRLGFIANPQAPGTRPLYRLYHPGTNDHLYTTSANELVVATRDAEYWYEGIAGYVY